METSPPPPNIKSSFVEEFSPRERVQKFAEGLFFKLPEDAKERPSGQNLFEIKGIEQRNIYPPLISEGTISILPGKIKALVGPNGSGKTTLFKTFLQNNLPAEIKHKPGLTIGYLPQEGNFVVVTNLTLEQTIDQLADIIYEQNNYDSEVYSIVATYKNLFFQGVLENKIGQLSGGEKTKLQMLALLLRKPDVIFLDEATNHIDQGGQVLLTALIRNLKKSGVSFVCSSHNKKFLQELCQDGIIEISVSEKVRTVKENEQYQPEEKSKSLKLKLPWQGDKCILSGRPFEGAYFNILGQKVYFEYLEPNEKVVLIGPNGSGKTTFLRQLCEGRFNSGVFPAYLPQELPENVLNGNLDQMVEWCVKNNYSFDTKTAKANFYRNLDQSDIKKRRSKNTNWQELQFKSLSLGEQRFLWFLAVASSPGFNFLVLDEPTNHMSPEFQAVITESIKSFPGSVLVVTHDSELIKEMQEQSGFWFLERGSSVIDSSSGIDKYYTDMQRKAQQTVKQLSLN